MPFHVSFTVLSIQKNDPEPKSQMSKPKIKKRGRPVLRDERSDYKLSVRLTPMEERILRDYCWRYDISASNVIRSSLQILGVIPEW